MRNSQTDFKSIFKSEFYCWN